MVLTAWEERQRAVELSKEEKLRAEAERAWADEEELVRENQFDEAWAQQTAIAMAKVKAQEKRSEFVAETYTPLEPHVFVPSGFDHYVPQQDDYDSELVLRDPTVHLSTTWR